MKKKVLALVAAILCLILAGCAKKPPLGDWSCTIDFSPSVTAALEETVGLGEYADLFTFSDLSARTTWHFHEDGTYTVEVDKASLDRMADTLKTGLGEGAARFAEAYVNDHPDPFLGLDPTLVKEVVAERMEGVLGSLADDLEADIRSRLTALEDSGTYTVQDGVLTLSGGSGQRSYRLTVSGGSLLLELLSGGSSDEVSPLTLVKLKK